ncbi:hypothetical protein T265_02700 [Opisthorchis viverrini]|uniref:Uncharacterized protein n=1 Tax=Opisthorchis viverrini TaxID=6198 RepID=A0A074ZYF7_OPIVI|nr:hypothetical protein T265_02700 [Opisthorchis viverrini]KER31027.1 hypothetical protein T265_02700 [Opisthorchis viverrini]
MATSCLARWSCLLCSPSTAESSFFFCDCNVASGALTNYRARGTNSATLNCQLLSPTTIDRQEQAAHHLTGQTAAPGPTLRPVPGKPNPATALSSVLCVPMRRCAIAYPPYFISEGQNQNSRSLLGTRLQGLYIFLKFGIRGIKGETKYMIHELGYSDSIRAIIRGQSDDPCKINTTFFGSNTKAAAVTMVENEDIPEYRADEIDRPFQWLPPSDAYISLYPLFHVVETDSPESPRVQRFGE